MLSSLQPSPADPILQIIAEFQADPRPNKIDLGVGVYKDGAGQTVIPKAVKLAEARLLESQETKSYLGLLGDVDFASQMLGLVLGDAAPAGRVSAIQTAGGGGATYSFRCSHPGENKAIATAERTAADLVFKRSSTGAFAFG